MRIQHLRFPVRTVLGLCLSGFLASGHTRAAEAESASSQKERELIKVLQSNAAPDEKAITCKQLAIYGTKESVPALAALLPNQELSSWARIPLEAIPGPAPEKALRDAVEKLQGRLLIGVINSIGARRDAKAVSLLAKKLNDNDANVASAAAESLGRIGGSQAAKTLKAKLTSAPTDVRSAVAEGCIRCAEKSMVEGRYSEAVKLYDFVRQAQVPKERILEATRGAILARRSDGIPLLLAQLRSPDKALLGIGLHTARELPGPEATKAITTEVRQCAPERQPLILLALAERDDPAALPAIFDAARSGPKNLRLVAVGILDRGGNPASLPVLLEVAGSDDSDLAQPAKAALGRLPGVDNEVLTRLSRADTGSRPVLLEVAGRRGMESALPTMLQYADSSETKSRAAALNAIATIGGDTEATALVKLLQAQQSADKRADTEKALLAISSRKGASCTHIVLPLAKNNDPELRRIALRGLAAAGGPEALQAVRAATEDSDEGVCDEAVQTLSSWPNTWPEDKDVADPLLALAKSAKKPSHQVLAERGFLQFLLGDEKLSADDKLHRVDQILPLLNRPEDKRLAIAVIRQIQKPEALDLLVGFAADSAIAEEACSAIIDVTTQPKTKLPKEARQQALQTAAEKAPSDTLKQKAQNALQKLS